MPEFKITYQNKTEGVPGGPRYEHVVVAAGRYAALNVFRVRFPNAFTIDCDPYNPCREIQNEGVAVNRWKKGDKFKMNGHEYEITGELYGEAFGTTRVRRNGGYTHFLYLGDHRGLGIERIEPDYEDGELYRDADGEVFEYDGSENVYSPWTAVVAKTGSTLVGDHYVEGYPNTPIVKVKIVEAL
jgi:hypothetical protein